MSVDMQMIVGQVSDSVTRQSADNVEIVGLGCANPTYAPELIWQRMTLKNAGVSLIDCDHKTPPHADEGYPYIAIPQLKNGHITLEGVRLISKSDYLDWTKKLKPQEDDVIVVRRCNSGDSAVVPRGLECAIGQNLVILRADGTTVNPKFLRWLIRGPDWWEQVKKFINVGAVFDSLKCGEIPQYELLIPPLAHQKEIATILGALDDRIELLRETNATLEAIAQALFKSWFVDFDPVHANAALLPSPCGRGGEGRQSTSPLPNPLPQGEGAVLPPEIAALFPDSFEESELGLIPQGWNICSFAETIDIIGGGTPKTAISEYWNGEIPWFSVVDAPKTTDVFVIDTEKHITQAGLEKSSTKLLSVGTTIISARGTVGRLALVGQEMAMNQSCYGLRGKAGDDFFTYLSTYRLIETLKQRTHGSVFDTITRDTLAGITVLYPNKPVISAFENQLSPLMERIKENLKQAQTLTTLRDTLLPRLISGQLRLPDTEAMLEETT